MEREPSLIRKEFQRAASAFARRTAGRFDDLEVVPFSRVQPNETVLEVGAGTGNFLSLFAEQAARLVAFDITPAMLAEARVRWPDMWAVVGDAHGLPFASSSIDLVTSAQALHHIHRPIPVIKEMARVAGRGGRVLIVDQAAPERYEEAIVMNELEKVRDPSHAQSRPPSAFRIMLRTAGLRLLDEKVVEGPQRLSGWMWPDEFPPERIEAVRDFIERHGTETGMGFEREGDDWTFTRRRVALLAVKIDTPA